MLFLLSASIENIARRSCNVSYHKKANCKISLSKYCLFQDCAEYFGEDPKTGDCNTFFSVIVRFIATWKSAEEDNVKRQKLLEAENRKNQAGNPEDSQKRPETAANMKNAMINELKTRNNRNLMVKPGVNEIQDGTFEGIILDMKSQPYRNEGMHRSFRRHKKTPSESMTVTTNETEPL